MSERELLSRLMSQTLLENIDGQAFDLASEPNTMVNVSTADNRTLFNKIIPFVLAKEPMQQLLKTKLFPFYSTSFCYQAILPNQIFSDLYQKLFCLVPQLI